MSKNLRRNNTDAESTKEELREMFKTGVSKTISSYDDIEMSDDEFNEIMQNLFKEMCTSIDYESFFAFLTDLLEKVTFKQIKVYCENYYNKNMNQEQHNAIEMLCNVRLWMQENLSKILLTDTDECKQYRNCFVKDGINDILALYNLPLFKSDAASIDIPIYAHETGRKKSVLEVQKIYYKSMKTLDNDIRKYIKEIDNTFGTTYLDIYKTEEQLK